MHCYISCCTAHWPLSNFNCSFPVWVSSCISSLFVCRLSTTTERISLWETPLRSTTCLYNIGPAEIADLLVNMEMPPKNKTRKESIFDFVNTESFFQSRDEQQAKVFWIFNFFLLLVNLLPRNSCQHFEQLNSIE